MNLAEIETFLMIVQTKSITKTAENLFLSQPTISHRLKALETELNMRLVVRNKGFKSIELTSRGEEFIPIADRWLSLWKETEMLQHGIENLYLTIGSIDTLNSTLLANFYSNMCYAEFPIHLKIRTHQSYEIYELLEKHEVDVGFVYHNLHFKNIISEPLLEEELYIVQPQNTSLRKRRIHTDELDPAKELFFNWDTNYQIWHDQWISKLNRPIIQVDTFQLIRHFLESGNMWMIAPASIIRELEKTNHYCISEIANCPRPPKRVTYQIRHHISPASASRAIDIFNRSLKKYLEQTSWGSLNLIYDKSGKIIL